MTTKNIFDATPSALGYIYQVRFALLLALRQVHEVNDPDECFVSIEKLDDVAFEENGDPVELLQTKYHGAPGNLTDRSADLWKTVRVWSEFLSDSDRNFERATFTLLTTETAAPNTISFLLGTDSQNRDVKTALARMREIAKETTNVTNKVAYATFAALKPWQQEKLLSSTYVVGNSPDILEVEKQIRRMVRTSASNNHNEAFTTRLEGAWFKKVLEVLASSEVNVIGLSELIYMLDDLRSQFLPGNLPSDYDDSSPDIIDIENDDRVFVEQLRLIGANHNAIRIALINYYRAYEQRSRWSRENLVNPGELKKYLNRLKEEWEHHSSLVELDGGSSADEKMDLGKQLYKTCQTEGAIPIRTEFKAPYVARGSYHTLSDSGEVGWHPDYLQLINLEDDLSVA